MTRCSALKVPLGVPVTFPTAPCDCQIMLINRGSYHMTWRMIKPCARHRDLPQEVLAFYTGEVEYDELAAVLQGLITDQQ